MRIRNILLMSALLAPISAFAGDLVLKLGTTNDPRIPITGLVTVNPSSGDVIVDPVASAGTAGDGWCPVGTGGGTPAPTVNYSVDNASLPVGGGTVNLSWTSTNATGCTASSSPSVNGWSGSVATSGSVAVALSASGTYTFSLYCSGAGGNSGTSTRQVVVATATTSTECTNRPAPTQLTRQTTFYNGGIYAHNSNKDIPGGTTSVTTHDPVLGPFGYTYINEKEDAYIPIENAKYISLQFSTAGLASGTYGRVSWEQPTSNGAPLTVMLSPCPGDFQYVTSAKCKVTLGYGALTWYITSGTSPSTTCKLEPNKTYYINAAFVESTDYTTGSCTVGQPYCNWFVTNQRLTN